MILELQLVLILLEESLLGAPEILEDFSYLEDEVVVIIIIFPVDQDSLMCPLPLLSTTNSVLHLLQTLD